MADRGTSCTSMIWQTVSFVLFKAWKWVIRILTGKPEIYRLCLTYPEGSKYNILVRTISILGSIRASKYQKLREIASDRTMEVSTAVNVIVGLKKPRNLPPNLLNPYQRCLTSSCAKIISLSRLKYHVHKLRSEAYSMNNASHEGLLQELWELLMPGTELRERITKQWQEIGFQGNNPATDFRGMGLLGLKSMVYFSKLKLDESRRLLGLSKHPTLGYPYAITAINMTATVVELTDTCQLDQQYISMGDISSENPPEYHFYQVFMSVFVEFDEFWRESKPENIMDFAKVKEKFVNKIQEDIGKKGTLSFVC